MTTIEFSIVTDAPNVIGKTITPAASIEGTFRGELNVLTPTIKVAGSQSLEYNYCKIPSLSRYYFIDKITIDPMGLTIYECSIDVLTTYESELIELLTNQSANKKIVQSFTALPETTTNVLVVTQGGEG